MRAVVFVTKTGVRIFSRSSGVNDPTRPLEKTSALPHLAGLKFPGLNGVVLDSEILAPGIDSARLSGNIHRNEITDENRKVKLFVFDVLRYGARDLTCQPLRERIACFVEAQSEEEARRLPFEHSEIELPDDPVQVIETIEDDVKLISIKLVEQIS